MAMVPHIVLFWAYFSAQRHEIAPAFDMTLFSIENVPEKESILPEADLF